MNDRTRMSQKLISLGYILVSEKSGYDLFHSNQVHGSIYVKNNYISATGGLRIIEESVPRSSTDPKGNPEWRDWSLDQVVTLLESLSKSSKDIHQYAHKQVDTIGDSSLNQPSVVANLDFTLPKASINWQSTGLYIAYPTTKILKPIYPGYATKVNHAHTKIGIAKDSFFARKNSYISIFGGEVQFIPIIEINKDILPALEQKIINGLLQRFRRVGRAREWFETADRYQVYAIVMNIINPISPNA